MNQERTIRETLKYCGIKNVSVNAVYEHIKAIEAEEEEFYKLANKKVAINILGTLYTLVPYVDNSAPCGKCAFFNKFDLKCIFPTDRRTRKCTNRPGTSKGWNNTEYRKLSEDEYKYYEVERE